MARRTRLPRSAAIAGDDSGALNASPVGQLAWIVEKFRPGQSGVETRTRRWSRSLLTNVRLYWFTRSGGARPVQSELSIRPDGCTGRYGGWGCSTQSPHAAGHGSQHQGLLEGTPRGRALSSHGRASRLVDDLRPSPRDCVDKSVLEESGLARRDAAGLLLCGVSIRSNLSCYRRVCAVGRDREPGGGVGALTWSRSGTAGVESDSSGDALRSSA